MLIPRSAGRGPIDRLSAPLQNSGMPQRLEKISKIFVSDDHPICLSGLEASIKATFSQPVTVQLFLSGQSLLEQFAVSRPDLVLLDLHLAGTSGVNALKELRKLEPDLPIMVITASREPHNLMAAVQAGAKAVLSKSHDLETFRKSLLHVLGTDVTSTLIDTSLQDLMKNDSNVDLTPREWEVLSEIARGLTNEDIALRLNCAVETVKSHRVKLGQKTGSRNRSELTAWYLQRKN